ncbi:hypothetical protein V6Z12_D13G096200, partial [Gossypium hirsutum]
MDTKTTLFNGDLKEEFCMKQTKGFFSSDGEQLECKIKISIYTLKKSLSHMDDILLATNDKGSLYELKQFHSKNFDVKDIGEASYDIDIKIYRNKGEARIIIIFLVKNNKSGNRNKHIDIKYLSIWERVKETTVIIERISIELIIVDPLAKGLPPMSFKNHLA